MTGSARRPLFATTSAAVLTLFVTGTGLRGSPDVALVADAQRGCAADYAKFCSQHHASATIQASCLRQYWVNLSPACRRTLAKPKGTTDDDSQSGDAAN